MLLLAWLAVCMRFDLRTRQVPAVLTLLPLAAAALLRLSLGGWPVVLQVAALVLISDFPRPKWRIPLAALASVLALTVSGSGELMFAQLVVFAVWALWELGATGGADAKIILTLVLLSGDGLVFLPIVFVGGFQGLAGLLRHRKTIPYTVAITLGTALWLGLRAGWIQI